MKVGINKEEVTHEMWKNSYAHEQNALSLLTRFSKKERRRFIRKKGRKNNGQ